MSPRIQSGDEAPPPRPWIHPRDLMLTSDVRRFVGGRDADGKPTPLDRHTLIRWREKRRFPAPIRSIKVGKGAKAQVVDIYDRRDVRAWLRENS